MLAARVKIAVLLLSITLLSTSSRCWLKRSKMKFRRPAPAIENVLRDFSQSLAAFWTDLGDLEEDTVVVTMSELGRTARENGNRESYHGHANVMFVLRGPVKGGKVYGRWPGLDQSQLYEGRDLALTTDFRKFVGEAVARHMGNKNLNEVLPGYENQPGRFLRLMG